VNLKQKVNKQTKKQVNEKLNHPLAKFNVLRESLFTKSAKCFNEDMPLITRSK
jgi:hypothetical protein